MPERAVAHRLSSPLSRFRAAVFRPRLTTRRPSLVARRSTEPGAALFGRLRLNLTLWYSGVLAAALLLGGGAVYFGLQQLLMRPIETDLDAF
ncbi:MAG: hypothetical protein M3Q65_08210, partial [Chloroflexota bacterium]|nr:hypothetical protein [Chloroflexota bacterium]